MDKIFLSWSGPRSLALAKKLKYTLEALTRIDVFFSEEDIRKGDDWWKKVIDELSKCNALVAVLTPENVDSNWIHYEAGAFIAKDNKDSFFPLKCFGETTKYDLDKPLSSFQKTKFELTDKSDKDALKKELIRLCKSILEKSVSNKKSDLVEGRIRGHNWDDLFQEYTSLQSYKNTNLKYKEEINLLNNKNPNELLEFIMEKKKEDFFTNLRNASEKTSKVTFDYVSYPEILISLTDTYKEEISIKAVAVVDETEEFWKSETALKIMRQGSHDISQRIFVFDSPKHLLEYLPHLQKWSQYYNVRVISKQSATHALRNNSPHDFSIIGRRKNESILAKYFRLDPKDLYETLKIRFSSNEKEINRALKAYELLHKKSVEVKTNLNDESFVRLIFEEGKTRKHFGKNIEMSGYIDIEAYDLHEEKHPYYLEMIELILSKLSDKNKQSKDMKILEVGAGTGLFTKHLIKRCSNLSIDCLEIDRECYKTLKQRISDMKEDCISKNISVRVLNRDSRRYYKPNIKYDFVISVFADHHIKPLDQVMYFENISRNLEKNGRFIIGDEFLRFHNEEDVLEWKKALKDYHNFIINMAYSEGNNELVELEKQALHSGLLEIGDFKISTEEYENFLDDARMDIVFKQKIGPLEHETVEDIGGIFVYEVQKLE